VRTAVAAPPPHSQAAAPGPRTTSCVVARANTVASVNSRCCLQQPAACASKFRRRVSVTPCKQHPTAATAARLRVRVSRRQQQRQRDMGSSGRSAGVQAQRPQRWQRRRQRGRWCAPFTRRPIRPAPHSAAAAAAAAATQHAPPAANQTRKGGSSGRGAGAARYLHVRRKDCGAADVRAQVALLLLLPLLLLQNDARSGSCRLKQLPRRRPHSGRSRRTAARVAGNKGLDAWPNAGIASLVTTLLGSPPAAAACCCRFGCSWRRCRPAGQRRGRYLPDAADASSGDTHTAATAGCAACHAALAACCPPPPPPVPITTCTPARRVHSRQQRLVWCTDATAVGTGRQVAPLALCHAPCPLPWAGGAPHRCVQTKGERCTAEVARRGTRHSPCRKQQATTTRDDVGWDGGWWIPPLLPPPPLPLLPLPTDGNERREGGATTTTLVDWPQLAQCVDGCGAGNEEERRARGGRRRGEGEGKVAATQPACDRNNSGVLQHWGHHVPFIAHHASAAWVEGRLVRLLRRSGREMEWQVGQVVHTRLTHLPPPVVRGR